MPYSITKLLLCLDAMIVYGLLLTVLSRTVALQPRYSLRDDELHLLDFKCQTPSSPGGCLVKLKFYA